MQSWDMSFDWASSGQGRRDGRGGTGRGARDSMSRWDSSKKSSAHDIFFAILLFFDVSPNIPFIFFPSQKPRPTGKKTPSRPCCTWMEVGRPAIRWSSGRYGIHKVWKEAMKMLDVFFKKWFVLQKGNIAMPLYLVYRFKLATFGTKVLQASWNPSWYQESFLDLILLSVLRAGSEVYSFRV